MPSPTMWNTVLQATAITAFCLILTHHIGETMFDKIYNNEGFLNMSYAFNVSMPPNSTNERPGRLTLEAGDGGNNTSLTNNTFNAKGTEEESFYRRQLPRDVLINFVLYALKYYWLIGLERLLPARPRRNVVLHEGKEKVEEGEDREEEVVKKWIAQGRIRRATLNWCNTFLKWVLDLTVGKVWYHTAGHVMRQILKLQPPRKLLKGARQHLFMHFLSSFLSTEPLAELIAFIIVPAHKQIVFLAGADLVISIFFTTVVRVFASWAITTDYAQAMMRNMTEAKLKGERVSGFERYNREL